MFIKISMTKKYIGAFILIIVLPIFFIGYFVYFQYTKVLINNFSDKASQTMDQISLEIDNKLRDSSLIISALSREDVYELSHENNISELITRWNRTIDIGERYDLSQKIDNKLEDIFNYVNGVEDIVVFLKNQGVYIYRHYPDEDEKVIRNADWYKMTLSKKGNVVVINSLMNLASKSKITHFFSLAISPDVPALSSDVELMYISVDTNLFDDFYRSNNSNVYGDMVILDENGKIILSKNKMSIGKIYTDIPDLDEKMKRNPKSFYETINGKKMLVSTRITGKAHWKVINLVSYKELTGNIAATTNLMILITAGILILFIIFSIFFFRSIINPIYSLIKEMRKVQKGNFESSVEIKQNRETNELGSTFNKMVKEIKKLMIENDRKERERGKAEIDALQSQINPHFVSNTLSSIRFMAMVARVDSIKDMTEAFIKIVSDSFNRGGKLTTIEKELETLKSYVYIMKVRHGNKYDVFFDMNEDIKNYYILKMVIQPLLENAILHGVNDLDKKGIIKVTGTKNEEGVLIEIEDNGIGMTAEQIEKLLSEDCRNEKGFTGMGVLNVDRRIKLNHGEKFGLKIQSVLGECTKVKVFIPILDSDEGGN